MQATSVELCIGIDICKSRLDVADNADSPPWSMANDESGIVPLMSDSIRFTPLSS